MSKLTALSLANCTAITEKSLEIISMKCKELKHLYLNGCNQLDTTAILLLVQSLPSLSTLEVYKVTHDYLLVEDIKSYKPELNMGLFELQYNASTGKEYTIIDDNNKIPELKEVTFCRHDTVFQTRACWGNIRGRIVYSHQDYIYAGNYPKQILYSCEAHRQEDLGDENYCLCNICELLCIPESMHTEHCCKVCFDESQIRQENKWINLSQISSFSFADIIGKTLYIADIRNLPPTLRHRGGVKCLIDYKQPILEIQEEEDNDEEEEDKKISTTINNNINEEKNNDNLLEHKTINNEFDNDNDDDMTSFWEGNSAILSNSTINDYDDTNTTTTELTSLLQKNDNNKDFKEQDEKKN